MRHRRTFTFVFMCLTCAIMLSACKKENIDETITLTPNQSASARIVGEWELYKVEKQELIGDSITLDPPQAFHSMVWFDQTSPMANELTVEYHNDGTFQSFYAGVNTFQGDWEQINDSTFTQTYDEGWQDYPTEFLVTVYCDHTMSVEWHREPPAGNHEFQDADWHVIEYYRTPGTTECDDLIDYFTE